MVIKTHLGNKKEVPLWRSVFNPLDPTDFDSICGISPGFPEIPSRFPQTVSKYPNLKCHLNITIYQSGMISSVFVREFQWL